MIRNHLVKFIVPVLCSLSVAHAVIPKIPLLDPNDPLVKNIKPVSDCNYNMFSINKYGWFITQKHDTPPQPDSRWKKIEYFPHPYLGFALIKVVDDSAERDPVQMLKYLANKNDLKNNANWVVSMAPVPNPFFNEDNLSEIQDNTKPLGVISKVERQKKGILFLSSGESVDRFYHELWPQLKRKFIDLCSKNEDCIKSLLEDPIYKMSYLNKNESQAVQKKICDLNEKKKKAIQGYIQYLLCTSQSKCNPLEDQKYFSKSPFILNFDKEIDILKSSAPNLKRDSLLKEYLEKLWENHQQELKKEQEDHLTRKNFFKPFSKNYLQLSLDSQKWAKESVVNSFRATNLGVAGKEDHGGLILVRSKDSHLNNNRYDYYNKIAGITLMKEYGFIENETSVAVDLTTDEVHGWISKTMEDYYNPKDAIDKGKRPAEDNAGPSDRKKRFLIK